MNGEAADVPAARVQILSTEHWSLLATRSMTWSEVMSRITIHLTVTSAALVVLALVVQASGFGTGFHVLSIGLASVVLLLGSLTGVRVRNASVEDHAIVMGMNRLRAGYVALDAGVADYLVTSSHDDRAGVMQTYSLGAPRTTLSHVLGSTGLFMNAVNTVVAGSLGALVAGAAGAGPWVIALVGAAAAAGYLGVMLVIGRRAFAGVPLEPRFPSDPSQR